MTDLTPNERQAALDAAADCCREGDFLAAERICRQILGRNPVDRKAWSILVVALIQRGENLAALDASRHALSLHPDAPEVLYNQGLALERLDRLEEAVASYSQALALAPSFAEAKLNRAAVWIRQGALSEAERSLKELVLAVPDSAGAHHNLGDVLRRQGRHAEAIESFSRAVALDPLNGLTWSLLGDMYLESSRSSEAAACYSTALKANPNFVPGLVGLGNVYKCQANWDLAAQCYRQAIQLDPDSFAAHNNLGLVLRNLGCLDEALECYEKAIAANPSSPEAYSNLGSCLKDRGELASAVAAYRQALAITPDMATVRSNLLYALLYEPTYTPAAILQEHRQWDAIHAAKHSPRIAPHKNHRDANRRLRVGYVSPHFRLHAEGFFMVPCFAAHNHANFEIVCYSDVAHPDQVTARLRASADKWHDTRGLSDDRLADLIRSDQIDILVDLTMHMEENRLLALARKPAPVQVCWLAYPGTTGLSTIDYRLTDPYLDPPGEFDDHYAERSFHLPETFWCYDPLGDYPQVPQPPSVRTGHITFGCLNNFCKVNEGVLDLWSSVLHSVGRSQLMLLAPTGSARNKLIEQFVRRGIPEHRLNPVASRQRPEYLALYNQIDVCLDTVPYNGHTTSLDALWMGVPVVTLVGQTVVGRAGQSQLSNLGLTELIARAPADYVRLAATLASEPHRLVQLRQTLRERMQHSPLMDAPRFTRHLENAYRQMWQTWCAGNANSRG